MQITHAVARIYLIHISKKSNFSHSAKNISAKFLEINLQNSCGHANCEMK